MRSAAATAMAAAAPSTTPGETNEVQATLHALRQGTRARDALPARRAGLGRAHRLGARAGEELAPHGVRLPVPVRWICRSACLAVGARHRRALGGAGRQSRP